MESGVVVGKRKQAQQFVIVAPRQDGGGAIALHTLAYEIARSGRKCRFFFATESMLQERRALIRWAEWIWSNAKDYIKCFLVRVVKKENLPRRFHFEDIVSPSVPYCARKRFPYAGRKTIVIYPEICYGNPLRAKRVVRWLLYHYPYSGDSEAYGNDDYFVCFRKVFNNWELNPLGRTLNVVHYNLDLYKQTNFGKRDGKCFIIRKGATRDDLPKSFDGPVIDDLSEIDKVRFFNECEYCISYDLQTAYSEIAAMCGCVSIVIPEKGKTRSDYVDDQEQRYGIACGFSNEEIDYALKTRQLVRQHYMDCNMKSANSALSFIAECEEHFGI